MAYLNLKPVEFDALGKKAQAAFQWEGRVLLPKYDGCFAMVAFVDGEPFYVMSRTGEVVKSMAHIGPALLKTYPWLASTRGGVMVLGEAWNPGCEFSDLSGIFRRQYPQPDLGFAPFDIVGWAPIPDSDGMPRLHSDRPYRHRLNDLEKGAMGNGIYCPVPADCASKDQAWSYAQTLKRMGGYDGAICADAAASYTPGAGKGGEFIKLKPLLSYSLECTGYEAAVGAKTGRATVALVVRFKEGRPLRVATGLSFVQQDNPEQFVGKIIEVEAMGLSSNGLLREPRFKGVRDDARPDF